MNDSHDNAQDDRAMYHRIQTNLAVEAFRKQELKRLQLEMAEHALTKLLNGTIDLDRYHEETEQIRRQFELKRADYARLGKLPKEEPAPFTDEQEHKRVRITLADGTEDVLLIGHEYELETMIPGVQRVPRWSRMSFLGENRGDMDPLQFNARPAAGTQALKPSWIRQVIPLGYSRGREDALRYVGEKTRRTQAATRQAARRG
jgi:hypothetical protein